MTSKYILLLGSLLFLLLVTSCIAFFLDRYHPNLIVQMPGEEMPLPVTQKRSQSLPSNENGDLFLHEIPIDTLEENASSQTAPAAAPKTEVATSAVSPAPTIEHNATHRPSKSVKSAKEASSIPTKHTTAKQIAAKKGAETSVPKQPGPVSERKAAPKAPTVKQKHHPKPLSQKRQKVIIEPVLLVKSLAVSPSGRLYRWDKPLLEDVARLVKADRRRSVELKAASATRKSHTYLQHIRHYLINHGVPGNRIRSEEQSLRNGQNVQSTLHDLTIELSVIERNL